MSGSKEQQQHFLPIDEETYNCVQMLKLIDTEGPEEEPVPEVGLTLDTTSNFLLYVLRSVHCALTTAPLTHTLKRTMRSNWKGAKSTASDQLSVLLGFSNHVSSWSLVGCRAEIQCPAGL